MLTRSVLGRKASCAPLQPPRQQATVKALLSLPVDVLQGDAGVGKTMVMKVLVSAWERMGGGVVMSALAGKAALLLARSTFSAARPRVAYTTARLLRRLDETRQALDEGREPANGKVELNSGILLLLDEASMLDTVSLHSLVRHMQHGSRLLLVGDCPAPKGDARLRRTRHFSSPHTSHRARSWIGTALRGHGRPAG